jgi:hypothetical protein
MAKKRVQKNKSNTHTVTDDPNSHLTFSSASFPTLLVYTCHSYDFQELNYIHIYKFICK